MRLLVISALDVENPDSTPAQTLADITNVSDQAFLLLGNISTFANCELTVDGTSPDARASITVARQLGAELSQATAAHGLVLKTCSEAVADAYLELVPDETFGLRWTRRLRAQTLSLGEETLVTALSVDGHAAWANMYDNISSSLQCNVGGELLGVAQASAKLSDPDATVRRAAWDGIQAAWKGVDEPAAAILNAISGWRLSMNKRRGEAAGEPVHFLEPALHSNRMTKATLDAMMSAVTDAGGPVGRRALALQARALGVKTLHASDLFAPAPAVGGAKEAAGTPYEDAIDLIAKAVSKVDPSMGEIVRMMAAEGWIEGTSGSTKAPGAYCTCRYAVCLRAYMPVIDRSLSDYRYRLPGSARAPRLPLCILRLLHKRLNSRSRARPRLPQLGDAGHAAVRDALPDEPR